MTANTGDHQDGETLPRAGTLTLFLMVVTFWLINHPFKGIGGDGNFYAAQAVSILHPGMRLHDLFFAFGSQDNYSVFGAIYAWMVAHLGLYDATRVLLYAAYCAWLAAGMWLVRQLLSGLSFWIAIALLALVPGCYGSDHVFSYAEAYLNARICAEPFALLAITLALKKQRIAAIVAVTVAGAIHPVMAFPAVVLIACLLLPGRVLAALILAGIALAGALLLLDLPFLAGFTRVMDDTWLSLTRARSPYIFITEWRLEEYYMPLLFAALFFIARLQAGTAPAGRFWSAILATQAICLGLALLSCFWPLAIIVQMQPWRVMWLVNVLGIVCAVWWLFSVRQASPMNRWLLAGLVASSSSLVAGTANGLAALIMAALFAWHNSQNPVLPHRVKTLWILLIGLYAFIALVDLVQSMYLFIAAISFAAKDNPERFIDGLLAFWRFALPIASLSIIIAWYAVKHFPFRPIALAAMISVTIGALLTFDRTHGVLPLPGSHYKVSYPPPENITTLLGQNSVVYMEKGLSYVWFVLHLPHYVSHSQMAGLAFSRETALESKRRSDMLAPLKTQDIYLAWKNKPILKETAVRDDALLLACGDPLLDFILLTHEQPYREAARFYPFGPNEPLYHVYDCRQLRATAATRQQSL